VNDDPDSTIPPQRERITIRVPADITMLARRSHVQPSSHRAPTPEIHDKSMEKSNDEADPAPKYVGRAHDFPDRSVFSLCTGWCGMLEERLCA